MDDLSIWKVLASLINFLIVFWVFKYFLWEKIVLAIENRRKNIEASDNAEILAKEKIEQSQKEAEAIIEEAKEKAGYSDKTKAANIEKSPKVATKIAELRVILFQDTELGMLSIANRLNKILNDSINGVEIVEYIEEVGPEGTTTTKKKRKDKQLLAGVAAARELNSMLGYKATDELKLEEAKKKEKEKQLVLLE